MHVSRIGLTPLKGARHVTLRDVTLTATGPAGDRVFCLLDADRARVLRTVENPTLPGLGAAYDGTTLSLTFPDATTVSGTPTDSGRVVESDYWGRGTPLAVQDGPHAEAISAWLGRPVVLARAGAGDVVYGAPVSVVTTGDLSALAERTGDPSLVTQDARFRSTLTLDTPRAADSFGPGEQIRVGEAVLEVNAGIPRCAVVDLDPTLGSRNARVLGALPLVAGVPAFGIDARVVSPGTVHTGDTAGAA